MGCPVQQNFPTCTHRTMWSICFSLRLLQDTGLGKNSRDNALDFLGKGSSGQPLPHLGVLSKEEGWARGGPPCLGAPDKGVK